jgi:hypothetical protein
MFFIGLLSRFKTPLKGFVFFGGIVKKIEICAGILKAFQRSSIRL